jgi:hypothetical protein
MRTVVITGTALCAFSLVQHAAAQGASQEVEQKLATVKESVARNQAALQQYTWTEQTKISLKGDEKKSIEEICRYGPDGTVQKTPMGAPAPQQQLHGMRKRIVERKTDELKDYMERAAALVHDYVPPSPQAMQAAFQAGNASLGQGGPGMIQLQFRDYVKPGDTMAFNFAAGTKSLQSINVNTYLDQKDPVTLQVNFQTLPDGTNAIATVNLDAPAKQVQVVKQDTNYQRSGQQ